MRAGLPRSSRTFRTRAQTVLPLGSEVPPVSRGVAQSIHFPAPCVAVMERSLSVFRKLPVQRQCGSHLGLYWFANKTSAVRYSGGSAAQRAMLNKCGFAAQINIESEPDWPLGLFDPLKMPLDLPK